MFNKFKAINKTRLISAMMIVISTLIVFFAGSLSNDKPIETLSTYASEIVKTKTLNKNMFSITVQATSDSGGIADAYSEFHNLYGVFKQRSITFASAINLFEKEKKDKTHLIEIVDGDIKLSDNLSLFYLGPTGSTPYYGHYKHGTYPIETMFADDRSKYDVLPTKYVTYISQLHAEKMLEKYGEERDQEGNFSPEQYESLIANPERNVIDIRFDNEVHQYAIMNIYLRENYYYEGLNEVLGDFVAISYYCPMNLRQEQQNIYFMNEYPYQNNYFMQYINSVYSNKKFKVEVNHYNINSEINDSYLISFYYSNLNNRFQWIAILLIIISFLGLAVSLFLCFKKNVMSLKHLLVCLFVMLFIYSVFLLITKMTSSILFFTKFSTLVFFVFILIWLISYLSLRYFANNRSEIRRNRRKGDLNCEINI